MSRPTLAQLFISALRYLREHPDATDDEVAEACQIHRFERENTIVPARSTVAGEQGNR